MRLRRTSATFFFAFLAVSLFALSFFPIRKSHWWDETVYLQHAEIFFSGRDNYDEFWLRPPLFPFAISMLYRIIHSELMAHLIVYFSLIGVSIVLYFMAKRIGGEAAGFVAPALFVSSQWAIEMSRSVMTDIPSLLPLSLSLYFMLLGRPGLSGMFLGISSLTRFSSLFFFIPLLLYFALIDARKAARFAINFMVVLFPYLIWVASTYGSPFSVLLSARHAVSMPAQERLFYIYHAAEFLGLPSIAGLVICFILSSYRSRDESSLILIGALFLLFISSTPHKEARYALPFSLIASIVSAKGIATAIRNRRNIAILFSAITILASIGLSWKGLYDGSESPELKVSRFLRSINASIAYASANYPVIAYYSGAKTIIYPGNDRFLEFMEWKCIPGYVIVHNSSLPGRYIDSNPEFVRVGDVAGLDVYFFRADSCRDRNAIRH